MKKWYIVLLAFLCMAYLISCKKQEDFVDSISTFSDAYLSYDIQNEIYEFSVDDAGNLYYITYEEVSDSYTDQKDSNEQLTTYKQRQLSIRDSTGERLHQLEIDRQFQLAHDGNRTYGAIYNDKNGLDLMEIHIDIMKSNTGDVNESGTQPDEITFITAIENLTRVYKMEVDNDRIFTLGVHRDYLSQAERGLTNDGYNYGGEKIQWFDMKTGEWKLLDVLYPVTMSKTLDHKLLIYAYDKDLGFYFIFYDSKTDTYSEPYYSEIGYVDNIEVYTESYDIVYVNHVWNRYHLSTVNPMKPKSVAEIVPIGWDHARNLKTMGDYTYYLNESGDDIVRIRNEAYLRGNKDIVALAPTNTDMDLPFGLGYRFDTVMKPYYEVALEILSQNDQYDLYQFNSVDDTSVNIKKYGAFYPLNDVPGVKEYLDSCFPYIKDAAINQEGDIWMLPIFVNIPTYIYNSQFADTRGVQITKDMSFDQLSSMITMVRSEYEYQLLYENHIQSIVQNIFYQYVRSYTDFNEPIFRNIAEKIAEGWNYEKMGSDGNMMLKAYYYQDRNRNFLFMFNPTVKVQRNFLDDNYLNAMTIPSIGENKKSIATCYFLAVNPSGKNLKETLNYISSLSKYLNNPLNNKYVTLSNRDNYPETMYMDDLYEIYRNAEISFTYDKEIYINDFEAYLRGEIDLDSFIETSNNKLKIYLNE